MAYGFQNGKAKYEPFNKRLYLDHTQGDTWQDHFAFPLQVVENRTQISVRNDFVNVRLTLNNAPASGDLLYVADDYKPTTPVLMMVVRDAAPFVPVGTAFLGTDGRLQIFQSSAGNVQIGGGYMVRAHE